MCDCGCDVVCADNVATLFRASTLATMLMDQLMKLTAIDYLHAVLKGPVEKIADLRDSCEVHCNCVQYSTIYMYMYMLYMYMCTCIHVLCVSTGMRC